MPINKNKDIFVNDNELLKNNEKIPKIPLSKDHSSQFEKISFLTSY